MLYCRLIYLLSILCVRLTVKVMVGIPEGFKVGWYPPKKVGRVTLRSLIQLVSKCTGGINEQLLKTSGADVLSSRKKLKKTSDEGRGGQPSPHSLLYVGELDSNSPL